MSLIELIPSLEIVFIMKVPDGKKLASIAFLCTPSE
jgi:hypothetical protein